MLNLLSWTHFCSTIKIQLLLVIIQFLILISLARNSLRSYLVIPKLKTRLIWINLLFKFLCIKIIYTMLPHIYIIVNTFQQICFQKFPTYFDISVLYLLVKQRSLRQKETTKHYFLLFLYLYIAFPLSLDSFHLSYKSNIDASCWLISLE